MARIGKGSLDVTFDKGRIERDAQAAILPGMKRVAQDAALLWAGAKILQVGKEGLAELGEGQKQLALTEAHLKSTGGAANVTAEQITGLSSELMRLSGTDDEVIQQGENMLLTFTKIRNEVGDGNQVFDRATKAALDLSVSGFGSMESASVMLGKALNDPVKGITALGRAGVQFTAEQKATIASLVATGDVLGAQKIILAEVETQVGGTAEAYGKTLPGQLAIAEQSMANVKGQLVAGLAPALEIGAKGATFLAEQFGKMPEPLQATVGGLGLVVGGVLSLARPVNDTIALLGRFRATTDAATAASEAASAATAANAVVTTAAGASHGSLATYLYLEKAAAVEATVATETLTLAEIGGVGVLGPLGIGLAAGTAALLLFGKAHRDSKVDVAAFEAAIKSDSDTIGDNTKAFIANELVKKGLDDDLKRAGISYETLTAAIGGNRDALDEVNGKLDNHKIRTIEGEKWDSRLAEVVNQLTTGYAANADEVGRVADLTGDAADSTEDLGSATSSLVKVEAEFRANLSGTTDVLGNAKAAMDRYLGSLDDYFGKLDSAVDRESAWQAAIDDLTSSIKDNGRTIDLGTEQGRANVDASQAAAEAARDLAAAYVEQTGDVQGARDRMTIYAQAVDDAARKAGLTEDQVAILNEQLGLTPSDILIAFSADVGAALGPLQILQVRLDKINAALATTHQLNPDIRSGQFATGGFPVPGQTFEAGEQGWELAVLPHGIYQAPPSGMQIIDHIRSQELVGAAAGGRGSGDTVVRVPVYLDGRQITEVVERRVRISERGKR